MNRYELQQDKSGEWCVLDRHTRHPQFPSWKLVVATSTNHAEMVELVDCLNAAQSQSALSVIEFS